MKNGKLAFFIFFSFVSVGSMASQLIPLIKVNGYNSLQKNLILGGCALIAVLLSFWVGKKSDRIGRIKPFFMMNMLAYIISCIFVYLLPFYFIKGVMMAFMFGVIRMVMSCSETFLFVEKGENFAKYHCFGALGSVSGALLAGNIEMRGRVILCVLFGLLSLFLVWGLDERKREGHEITFKRMFELWENKKYMRLILVFFFLMLIGFADQYIVVEKMMNLDATPQMISLKYALQAFMEIPIYLGMAYLFSKISLNRLLLFCILMSSLKFVLYGMANHTILMIIVSLMQIVTHPLIVVLSKVMIQKVVPTELTATSQIVGFAFYFGLSGFMTPLIGQISSYFLNENQIIFLFALFGIFPLFIWNFIQKYDTVNAVMENENISN